MKAYRRGSRTWSRTWQRPVRRIGCPTGRRGQRGAALLAALLTAALVATLAAAGLWQQWRSVEVEAAERQRAQAAWVLAGALDWARLILREDAAAGNNADHPGEPWAVPLREARLATFLAASRNSDAAGSSVEQTFLSGEITDLQSRLNVNQLVEGSRISPTGLAAFTRLFAVLGLPESQVGTLAHQMLRATRAGAAGDGNPVPLPPQEPAQLGWLGLPASTVAALAPHVTVLPSRAPVNLNTASAPVIYAVVEGIGLAEAQRLVSQRAAAPLRTLADALGALGPQARPLEGQAGVSSRHFEIRGRLRMEQVVIEERSLVQRDGQNVRVLTRRRVPTQPATPSGQN
jgi:general secretion pathway protein K